MNVFVLNSGSSSIKAAYFEGGAGAHIDREPAWSAEVRWSALPSTAQLNWQTATHSGATSVAIDEQDGAVRGMLAAAMQTFGIAPDIVGHRVVHGLSETHCGLIDARVRALIERGAELAPLHNRAALAGIDAVSALFAGVPQAADFDTAFHTTLPAAAAAYAVPSEWFTIRGLRKYGFHGISHRYCAHRTAELLGADPSAIRMVSAHLGNGCSLAAIVGGKSVDTTMGFTPLDGLMMGSRSGSIDPGLLLHLLETKAYDAGELDRILNSQSGLAGVSQVSEDIRDVIAAAEGGAQPAQLALDIYIHRLATGIAGMTAASGGIDALAFTGGVGQHSAYVRRRVAERLAYLGITLGSANDDATGDREISAPTASVRVVVVQAREEFAIARDVAALVTRGAAVTAR